jgi:MFS family permease
MRDKPATLREHPLIDLLLTSKGNPKVLMLLEPLWGVPHSLIAPFATLYMFTQGVTDVQIGLILSISMFVQVFFSFFGGIIADKLGRKTATILGDFFGWSVACLVWALSSNFWLFLIAVLLNSFEYINQTAWQCLLVEDAREKDILGIYNWVTIGGLVSVFVAPLSGFLIDRFSLVPVMRVLYAVFSLNMLIKAYITLRCTTETRQGVIRMEQTKSVPVWKMVYEYKGLVGRVFKDKAAVQIMAVTVMLHIAVMVNSSFLSLYASTRLGVADRMLAFFPILRAVVMLFFMFVVQHRLEHIRLKIPMWIGLVIYDACQAMLVFTPPGQLALVVLYIVLEASANALVMPRKDAMLATSIDPKERARIMALVTSFMIAFSSPFGYLAGVLSSVDRRLPFVFTCGLYLISMIVVSRMKERRQDT